MSPAAPIKRAMRSLPLPLVVLLGLGTLAIVMTAVAGNRNSGGWTPTTSPNQSTHSTTSAPVIVNLGQASSSGSTWQARELLAAISKNTTASKVTITATDMGGEYVELSADFGKDELTRLHPGRTPEIWRGQVISRLRSAAEGGSLNSPK